MLIIIYLQSSKDIKFIWNVESGVNKNNKIWHHFGIKINKVFDVTIRKRLARKHAMHHQTKGNIEKRILNTRAINATAVEENRGIH